MQCIICKKIVRDDDKSVIQKPRIQGLLPLISSAEKRQDNRAKEILSKKEAILNGAIKIKYHIDCRKSYTSFPNIDRLLPSDSAAPVPQIILELGINRIVLILEECALSATVVEPKRRKVWYLFKQVNKKCLVLTYNL